MMIDKKSLIIEWEKQIKRLDDLILKYSRDGRIDLIPDIERMKSEAESYLADIL